MPRIGISITKSTSYRNSTQEFSNVYYFELTGTLPNQTQAEGFIDEQVNKERPVHSSAVTFVRGRCWSQIGDKTQNEMIAQKNLSGTGASAGSTTMDKERAVLIRLRAGVDSRGNPVYFRKWYHCCGSFGSVGFTSAHLQQTSGLSQGERDSITSQVSTIFEIGTSGGAGKICSKNGRAPTAGQPIQAHQFLEHHQLGDQWRAQ
jgi:hypothetical protein